MDANRKTGLAIFLSRGFGTTALADAKSVTNASVTGIGGVDYTISPDGLLDKIDRGLIYSTDNLFCESIFNS